jgi:hypothetical protein
MKPKIAFVKKHGFHRGGTEIWLQRFAAYLDKNKFDVYYYSEKPWIADQANFLLNHRVAVRSFPVDSANIIHTIEGEPKTWNGSPIVVESVSLVCNAKNRVPTWLFYRVMKDPICLYCSKRTEGNPCPVCGQNK